LIRTQIIADARRKRFPHRKFQSQKTKFRIKNVPTFLILYSAFDFNPANLRLSAPQMVFNGRIAACPAGTGRFLGYH
jgi:hypothetical protein